MGTLVESRSGHRSDVSMVFQNALARLRSECVVVSAATLTNLKRTSLRPSPQARQWHGGECLPSMGLLATRGAHKDKKAKRIQSSLSKLRPTVGRSLYLEGLEPSQSRQTKRCRALRIFCPFLTCLSA